MDTLADMQKGAQVEFAVVKASDGRRLLVRGEPGSVWLPKDTQRVIAHTHPGENIFAVRPSLGDAQTIQALGQKSSLVITENGYWLRFSAERKILSNQLNSTK